MGLKGKLRLGQNDKLLYKEEYKKFIHGRAKEKLSLNPEEIVIGGGSGARGGVSVGSGWYRGGKGGYRYKLESPMSNYESRGRIDDPMSSYESRGRIDDGYSASSIGVGDPRVQGQVNWGNYGNYGTPMMRTEPGDAIVYEDGYGGVLGTGGTAKFNNNFVGRGDESLPLREKLLMGNGDLMGMGNLDNLEQRSDGYLFTDEGSSSVTRNLGPQFGGATPRQDAQWLENLTQNSVHSQPPNNHLSHERGFDLAMDNDTLSRKLNHLRSGSMESVGSDFARIPTGNFFPSKLNLGLARQKISAETPNRDIYYSTNNPRSHLASTKPQQANQISFAADQSFNQNFLESRRSYYNQMSSSVNIPESNTNTNNSARPTSYKLLSDTKKKLFNTDAGFYQQNVDSSAYKLNLNMSGNKSYRPAGGNGI